jgi:hypothetical protein
VIDHDTSENLDHKNQTNHSSDYATIYQWVENQGYKNAKWRPKSDYFDDLYTYRLLHI